jgi:SAM-dependent methyltransferase
VELTGERTAPGIWHENYWFRRHEAAYLFAAPLAAGQEVLEAGCGEGYGAQTLLDAGAARVVGLDYDAAAAAHIRRAYPAVPVVRGNLVALPLPDRCVDLVVTYQVIEHLWDVPGYLAECARVLRDEGRLLLSTPNRPVFSPGLGRGEKPLNPFHSQEFDAEELVGLVQASGVTVEAVLGVHHGDAIAGFEQSRGPIVDAQLAAPADAWDAELAGFVAGLTAADFDVRDTGVEQALDLLVIAVRG